MAEINSEVLDLYRKWLKELEGKAHVHGHTESAATLTLAQVLWMRLAPPIKVDTKK